MSRPYERLSAFFNIVTMMGTDAFTPVRRPDPTGAFGPCLVTSRVAYESVGGHASVSSELLDDVALARRYRQSSRRVACLGGRGSLSFRMYPRGVRQLLEGWSKNVAAGARSTRVLTLLLIVAWISVCIETSVALAGARDGVALTVYVLVVAQVAWMLRRIGRFGALTAMLYPIPLAFFLLVFVRSTYLTLVRRRVSWKGRTFSSRA
jgi:4,4'-diaponeurosporenoate glycosyltransferase